MSNLLLRHWVSNYNDQWFYYKGIFQDLFQVNCMSIPVKKLTCSLVFKHKIVLWGFQGWNPDLPCNVRWLRRQNILTCKFHNDPLQCWRDTLDTFRSWNRSYQCHWNSSYCYSHKQHTFLQESQDCHKSCRHRQSNVNLKEFFSYLKYIKKNKVLSSKKVLPAYSSWHSQTGSLLLVSK